MRSFFIEDRPVEGTADFMTPAAIRKLFTGLTKSLEAILRDNAYEDGPRCGDRWDIVYHQTSISAGTIQFDDDESSDQPGITVYEFSKKHTFRESVLKSWIDATFCEMLCNTPPKNKKPGPDRNKVLKDIPWKRVSIVHTSSGQNINLIIRKYESYVSQDVPPGGKKRKRLACEDSPPLHASPTPPVEPPRTVGSFVLPSTIDMPHLQTPELATERPRQPSIDNSQDMWEDDSGPNMPTRSTVDIWREGTPPADTSYRERRSGSIDNPFREVLQEQAKLATLMAEQRAHNAELAKTNRDYAMQMQQQMRAEQCLKMEVNALRRCEHEVALKRAELESSLAREKAQNKALETRIACVERQLQHTNAVRHSMEIEISGLHRFLDEATRAAKRISTGYTPPTL